jgi:F-type H+-transporting ATPase subunit c
MSMRRAGFFRRSMTVCLLVLAIVSVIQGPALFAQDQAAAVTAANRHYIVSVAIGLGMIVIGAGLGIGKLAAAAAEGIARQPAAADKITGAVNLPLFLLEGVAILGEVFAFLVLVL